MSTDGGGASKYIAHVREREHEPTRRESHHSKLLADVTNGNRVPVALSESAAAPDTVAGHTGHAAAAVEGVAINGTDVWLVVKFFAEFARGSWECGLAIKELEQVQK